MQGGTGRVRTAAELADSLTLNTSVSGVEVTSPITSNWVETGIGLITFNPINRTPEQLSPVPLVFLKVRSGRICGRWSTPTTSQSAVCLVLLQFGPTWSEALAESRRMSNPQITTRTRLC